MHSQPPSYSQTGYSVLLIGAWPVGGFFGLDALLEIATRNE